MPEPSSAVLDAPPPAAAPPPPPSAPTEIPPGASAVTPIEQPEVPAGMTNIGALFSKSLADGKMADLVATTEQKQKKPEAKAEAKAPLEPKAEAAPQVEPAKVDPAVPAPPADKPKHDETFAQAPKTVKEANRQFAAMRTQRDELEKSRAELAELREKLAAVGGLDPKLKDDFELTKKELDALKAKTPELEKEIFAYRLESSEPWKQAVATPFAEIESTIQEIAEASGVDVSAIAAAIVIPDGAARRRAIAAIVEPMNRGDEAEIWDAAKRYKEVSQKALALKADSAAALAAIQAREGKQSEQSSARDQAELQGALEATDEFFYRQYDLMRPEKRAQNLPADIQKQLAESDEEIRRFNWGKMNADQRAAVVHNAARMPALLNLTARINNKMAHDHALALKERDAKIAQLEERLGQQTAATPQTDASDATLPDEVDPNSLNLGGMFAGAFGRART